MSEGSLKRKETFGDDTPNKRCNIENDDSHSLSPIECNNDVITDKEMKTLPQCPYRSTEPNMTEFYIINQDNTPSEDVGVDYSSEDSDVPPEDIDRMLEEAYSRNANGGKTLGCSVFSIFFLVCLN